MGPGGCFHGVNKSNQVGGEALRRKGQRAEAHCEGFVAKKRTSVRETNAIRRVSTESCKDDKFEREGQKGKKIKDEQVTWRRSPR